MRKIDNRANDAYAAYAARALLHFDLEGRSKMIRQQLGRISFCDAIGEHALSASIRRIVARERAQLTNLATALGASALCAKGREGARNRCRRDRREDAYVIE